MRPTRVLRQAGDVQTWSIDKSLPITLRPHTEAFKLKEFGSEIQILFT